MKMSEEVHNYYEKMVLEEAQKQGLDNKYDPDTLADFCCTVLNQLPPRYIRFNVDMEFYLSPKERSQMEDRVRLAIDTAMELIAKRGPHNG